MYIVSVQFTIHADHLDAFVPLIRANARASVADEPDCHQFDVCQDPDAPTQIYLYEVYSDRAAFDAHMQTKHYERFNAASAPMIAAKDVRFYTRLD